MLSDGRGRRCSLRGKGVDLASSFTSLRKEFGFCAQGSGRFLELESIKLRFPFWKAHFHYSEEPLPEAGEAGGPDTG